MLRALPGVFVAGEMLDFDAPTGGYLLQAAFATGARAADGHTRAGWRRRDMATDTLRALPLERPEAGHFTEPHFDKKFLRKV